MTLYDPEREISLADLAPERLTFHDTAYGGDGARHEWRMVDDLGLEDAGSLRRIQDELTRASALMTGDMGAEQLDAAAARLISTFEALFKLILPTLPTERVRAIPLRGKERLLAWWQARQPVREGSVGAPLAVASRTTRRPKPSPDSSPPTA